MADEKEVLGLDLDNREFLEKAFKSKSAIAELGDSKNLEGLVKGLLEIGPLLGVVGAAAFALKSSFEAVFEAESIRQVNEQFTVLAEQAGIAGESLKSGLVEASKGLIDDTDLIKAANKSLIELGDTAKDLPQVMTLARQVTAVFGGELSQNFEAINQAIASGNTRALKHMGIIIDQKKAYEEYAQSIGVSAGELSKAGQQQAIMNAVLEQGGERFKGTNPDIKEATNTWQEFKVAIAGIGEAVTLAFEKVAGPKIREFLREVADGAKTVKAYLESAFAEGAEKAAKDAELLEVKIKNLNKEIASLQDNKNQSMFSAFGMGAENTQRKIQELQAQAMEYQAQLDAYREKKKAEEALDDTEENQRLAKQQERAKIDEDKRQENLTRRRAEMAALQADLLQAELQNATDIEQVEQNFAGQRVVIEEQTFAKIAEIKEKFKGQEDVIRDQTLLLEMTKNEKLISLEEKLKEARLKALDQYVKKSTSDFDAVARAFEAGSRKNQLMLQDFGRVGQRTFDSFSKNAISAFKSVGEGSQNAGEAAKKFILNIVADEAEARGSVMLLASIWPPNPVGLAAGGGLIALSGLLRSLAGGGGSSSGASAAASSGVAAPEGFGTRTDTPPTLGDVRAQKQVTVQVMGNYFETEQTKTALVELIRQNQDATDYKVQQIAGT